MQSNEAKALEIIRVSNANMVHDIVDFKSLHEAQMEDLLAMAQWKEQQMIDKAIKWLSLNAQLYGGFNPGCLEKMVTNFKQSMSEE